MSRGNRELNIKGLEKLGFIVANKQDLKDKANEINRKIKYYDTLKINAREKLNEILEEIEMIELQERNNK